MVSKFIGRKDRYRKQRRLKHRAITLHSSLFDLASFKMNVYGQFQTPPMPHPIPKWVEALR